MIMLLIRTVQVAKHGKDPGVSAIHNLGGIMQDIEEFAGEKP
ncbi:MAG: hypothetical protein ACTS73_09500 [Arsenophonus sp. NEOnobi-MAG3]